MPISHPGNVNPSPGTKSKVPPVTWVGLFIALFGILIVRWSVSLFYPLFSFEATIWKEPLIWLCVVALLVIIRWGEGLPLTSIHLGTTPLKWSLLWGGVIALLCGLVGSLVALLTHFKGGEMGDALGRMPLWLVILVVLRAGIVEELFYRGYAIERLQLLGLNRYLAGFIPLLVFAFAHGVNGWANIVMALALGAVLTAIYLWRRDLVANMIGHFMVDFIALMLARISPHS